MVVMRQTTAAFVRRIQWVLPDCVGDARSPGFDVHTDIK